jgi:hypothetical protein
MSLDKVHPPHLLESLFMSPFVFLSRLESPVFLRNDRRRSDRARNSRGFQFRLELLEDRITPATLPTVTALNPTAGPLAGGTLVSISGTNFTGATAVDFGANAGSIVTISSSLITADSPAGTGTVNVTVTTPSGTSAISLADQFTYAAVPAVTAISPTSGPSTGGTTVTIIGSNLTGATAVDFGTTPATIVTVTSSLVTVDSPAGAVGTVDVTVTTPGGTSATSTADQFTYLTAPVVSAVSPTFGPPLGGTSVTIVGSGFTDATAVDFGTTSVPFTVVNPTTITTTSPAGNGTVNVTVTTSGGTSATSAADQFTYEPSVTGLSPASGSPSGGTVVTITGVGFTGASVVNFGTTALTNFVVESDTTITIDSPPGTGTVDVTVTTPAGTSATSTADQFTYSAAPTVSSISPISGPATGGTEVFITGTNLGDVTGVSFGSVAVPSGEFLSVSATQVVAIAPAATAIGPVNVTVTTAGGTSPTSSADLFFYSNADAVQPRVTAISPPAGPPSGGTFVTITGLGFDPVSTSLTAVFFGSTASPSFTILNASTIVAESPPGSVGAVDVTVITQGGASLNTPADLFTYTLNGPQVTGVRRFGFHAQPTYLVINFNQTLDPTSAQNVANYQIVGPAGQRIKVKSAVYNSGTNTVTLLTAQRLNIHVVFTLTINGTTSTGVTNTVGTLLDGAGTGEPGSDFVTSITSSNLAGPARQVTKLGLLDLRTARNEDKAVLRSARPELHKAAVDHLLATNSLKVARRHARH